MGEQSGQPDPVASDLVDSVLAHPGLQVQTTEAGNVVPDTQSEADYAVGFLKDPSGQPAAPQQTPEVTRPATTEPAQSPGQAPTGGRLLAGKYRSVEELERAALEKDRVLREREAELRAVRAVNQHLDEVLGPLRDKREDRRKPIPVTFDTQNQPIVDPESFMEMVSETAREIARAEVQGTLQPLSQLSQANSRLRAEYPEISRHEGEFAQWLGANPEMQERVTKDPSFYLEGAYLKFERERGLAAQVQNRETASAAQARVQSAKANAAPAGGGPVAIRRTTDQDAATQRLTALYKHGQETGDWKPYRQARLETALGTGFLDTLERTSWGR